MTFRFSAALAALLTLAPVTPCLAEARTAKTGEAQSAKAGGARILYTEALPHDRTVRDAATAVTRRARPCGTGSRISRGGEVAYHGETVGRPRRVFFDFKGVRPVAALQDVTLKFADDAVREIRLGRHPQNTTRVVLDLEGTDGYSVYSLYNPYRLVVDFHRASATAATVLVPVPTRG